jgi:hypothetical protein
MTDTRDRHPVRFCRRRTTENKSLSRRWELDEETSKRVNAISFKDFQKEIFEPTYEIFYRLGGCYRWEITRAIAARKMDVEEFLRLTDRKKAKKNFALLEGHIKLYEKTPTVQARVVEYLTGEIERQLYIGEKGAKFKRAHDTGIYSVMLLAGSADSRYCSGGRYAGAARCCIPLSHVGAPESSPSRAQVQ